jgi:4-hydroxyacetophenone monooxygenase
MGMDEEFIRKAVDEADLNALRMALYQATGDPVVAAMGLDRVVAPGGAGILTVVAEKDQADLKERVVAFLVDQAADHVRQDPDTDELDRLLQMVEGQPLREETLAVRRALPSFGEFPVRTGWSGERPELPEDFEVVVIGAGFSGIVMGVHLNLLGIPYRILERRHELGGVWSINTYPDARVDTLSSTYQYSFEKNYPWTEHFARQPEVRAYLEHVAKKYGVYDHILFDHDVIEGHFDEQSSRWVLTVANKEADPVTLTPNIVASATGTFAMPKDLEVDGVGDFEGELVHTTAWGADRTAKGKRVAVIGNGSTGVQLLARVAEDAEEVSVFQRTPQWISPRANYGEPMTAEQRFLLDNMPYYWNWSRYTAIMPLFDSHGLLVPDEEWIAKGGHVNERSDAIREGLTAYIKMKVGDRPDLIEKLIPSYAPITRRPVVDNNWYTALTRDNVELVTTPITKITDHAIVTEDGEERQVDMIIAAVGFQTTRYLAPTQYHGIGGVTIEDLWSEEGAKAHIGMTVPGFPNFFMLYGPNSQPLSGGVSLPSWFETWSLYAIKAIVAMIEGGYSQIEVRKDVYEEYNERLQKMAKDLILLRDEGSRERNYYINEWGRLQVNVPFETEDYFRMCQEPDLDEFVLS